MKKVFEELHLTPGVILTQELFEKIIPYFKDRFDNIKHNDYRIKLVFKSYNLRAY